MKNKFLLILFLIFSITVFSQNKSNYNWIFGDGLWLDFNNETPILNLTPPNTGFTALRNNITVSDIFGNLLFYGNGTEVYNKSHEVMPNGSELYGEEYGGANPIFSIPKPNSSTGYYLLSNRASGYNSGLFWSEIDMELDDGLGDINDNKNIQLTTSCTGKIVAVRHANLVDIWIISHSWNSNTYEAWLATENGISATPIVTNIGETISGGINDNRYGQMKTTLNGKLIAAAYQGVDAVEVFDFDNSTGQLSNHRLLSGLFEPYGVEFSPNGRFLYVSQDGNFQISGLTQFDLEAGDEIEISNSKIVLGDEVSRAGGLQLGPNGKIYFINDIYDHSIGVIGKPNELGIDCEFMEDAIFTIGNDLIYGFPAFMHDAFQASFFSISGNCFGGITDFSIIGFPYSIDSVVWNFDDSNSSNNFSNELSPSYEFSTSGFYDIHVTIYSNGEIFVLEEELFISSTDYDLIQDQILCENEPFIATTSIPNAKYLWSTNDTVSIIEISNSGDYWVQINVDTCTTLIDSFSINHLDAPNVNIGSIVQDCEGTMHTIDATDLNPNATYLWEDGSTDPQLEILTSSSTYFVTVTYPNGCTDSDNVIFFPFPFQVNANHANLTCFENESGVAVVIPTPGFDPFSFLWNTGDTTYTINELSVGNYMVTITNDIGCTKVEEFEISQPPELNPNLVVIDDDPMTSDSDGIVTINPSGGIAPYTIEWEEFGVVSNTVDNLAAGVYNITITDANDCELSIEVTVDGVTSFSELSFLEKIKIYPNPFFEKIIIEGEITDTVLIEVFDVFGKKIKTENMNLIGGKTELLLSDLKSGVYIISVSDLKNQLKYSSRIVKM